MEQPPPFNHLSYFKPGQTRVALNCVVPKVIHTCAYQSTLTLLDAHQMLRSPIQVTKIPRFEGNFLHVFSPIFAGKKR